MFGKESLVQQLTEAQTRITTLEAELVTARASAAPADVVASVKKDGVILGDTVALQTAAGVPSLQSQISDLKSQLSTLATLQAELATVKAELATAKAELVTAQANLEKKASNRALEVLGAVGAQPLAMKGEETPSAQPGAVTDPAAAYAAEKDPVAKSNLWAQHKDAIIASAKAADRKK